MELGLPCLVDEGTSEAVDVEMEERWAEDEELMMDVDMTTELQQEVYQQVCNKCCYDIIVVSAVDQQLIDQRLISS